MRSYPIYRLLRKLLLIDRNLIIQFGKKLWHYLHSAGIPVRIKLRVIIVMNWSFIDNDYVNSIFT